MSPVIISTETTENSVTIPKTNSTKNSKKSFMPAELTVSNLSYQERGKQFFDQITFTVPSGKIFGLVGQNGSGKTTLLSLISGFLQLDSGEIKIAQNVKIGFLRQDFQAPVQVSIGEIIAGAYPFKLDPLLNWQEWEKIEEMLSHFGLPNHQTQISELSGGQQRRVFLIKTLITQPDILLLDEPTNHLDIAGIEYLSNFLKQSNCTVLVISHDRAFLDEICDGMLEVWNKQIYPHTGNYSQYLKNRTARLENEAVTNQRTAQFVKRELEWVRAGVQARGTKNKGRLNKFYEIADQEKSPQLQQAFIQIPQGKPLGNVILNFQNFCIKNQNNDKNLLLNFNLKIEKQMKIGVIGPNGTGKTSLFQAILQEAFRQRPESVSELISQKDALKNPASYLNLDGTVRVGLNTVFNLVDQKRERLDLNKTVFEFVANNQEKIQFSNSSISSRNYLKSFLFEADQIDGSILNLSGGQRARVLLAKEFLREGNLLLLDEPTNDLDLDSIRSLELAVSQFEGSALIISHDREFLNQTCNYILSFDGEGEWTLSTGNYDRWYEEYGQKQTQNSLVNSLQSGSQNVQPKTSESLTYQNQEKYSNKELEKSFNLKPQKSDWHVKKEQKRKLKETEKNMEIIQKKIAKIEKETGDPEFFKKNDPKTATKLFDDLAAFHKELSELETLWLEGLE